MAAENKQYFQSFKKDKKARHSIDIYKECGADGWVTKAEEDLAKLS
jgi:hypothetical protein